MGQMFDRMHDKAMAATLCRYRDWKIEINCLLYEGLVRKTLCCDYVLFVNCDLATDRLKPWSLRCRTTLLDRYIFQAAFLTERPTLHLHLGFRISGLPCFQLEHWMPSEADAG